MSPGVSDWGIEDGTDGLLAVYFLGVEGVILTSLETLGIAAEMKEGLRCNLIYIISRSIAVNTVEELVVLTGYDSRIP